MSTFSKFTLVFLAVFGLFGSSRFAALLDLTSIDTFSTPHTPHPDVAILAIDNKSLNAVSRWPWDRKIHAQVIEKLKAFHPRVLGIDVNFSEVQDGANDQALTRAIRSASFPIVLPVEAVYLKGSEDPRRILRPLDSFGEASNVTLGHVNVALAPDGTVRDFPAPFDVEGNTFLPFSFAIRDVLRAEPLPQKRYAVNFAGPAGTFPTHSLSDFLEDRIPRQAFENKIVLIGATASDLHDTLPVPSYGLMAGVEWQANVLDNVLLGRPIKTISHTTSIALGMIVGGVLLTFSRRTKKGRSSVFFAVLTLFLAIGTSFIASRFDLAVPYFLTTLAVVGAFVFQSLFRWAEAELEKRRIKQTLQNYFSPQVMEAILQNPASLKLGGERKEITIFFSDIRSFTAITEMTDPTVLSRMLHEYFTEMTEEILATDGVVDKFIGDAIMAFWGAPLPQPDQADRAVRAALGMMERLKNLQVSWRERELPVFDIGIGINTGMATVGNMGSEKRFDYTVIGDSVNAAARLEGLNKEYTTHIIISEATKEKLTGNYLSRPLGEATVKGKRKAIKIFEIVVE